MKRHEVHELCVRLAEHGYGAHSATLDHVEVKVIEKIAAAFEPAMWVLVQALQVTAQMGAWEKIRVLASQPKP